MTFRGVSVIDYVIASLSGLKLMSTFTIKELNPFYSDGHSLLPYSVTLNINEPQPKENATI